MVKSYDLPVILKCFFTTFSSDKYPFKNDILEVWGELVFQFGNIFHILDSSVNINVLYLLSEVSFFIIFLLSEFKLISYLKPLLLHSNPNFSRCPI